jgi:hypothetical protein
MVYYRPRCTVSEPQVRHGHAVRTGACGKQPVTSPPRAERAGSETRTTTNHPSPPGSKQPVTTGPRDDRELAAPSAPRRDTCRAAMRRSPRGGLDAFRSVAAVDPAFCATRRRSSDPRLDPGESRICGERSGQKGVSSAVASLVRICRFPVGGGAGFVQVTGTLKICCSLSCF